MSEDGIKETTRLINNDACDILNTLKSERFKVFALTARMPKRAEMTYNSLLRAGVTFEEGFLPLKDFSIKYHRGIFYSPDVDGISTKLTFLYNVVEFLIRTGVQIGRVIFVHNEKRHFKGAPVLIKN